MHDHTKSHYTAIPWTLVSLYGVLAVLVLTPAALLACIYITCMLFFPSTTRPSAQSPTQLLSMATTPQVYVPQLTEKLVRHEGGLLHGGQEATGLLCNHLVPQATLAVGAGGGVEVRAVQQRLHHFVGHHLVLLLALHTLCRLHRWRGHTS